MTRLLKFSPGKGNAKLQSLGGVVYTFSLPSGWSCPSAKDCLSKAVLSNGKYHIQDGKHTQFRCFSATQEVVYPAVREQRQHNYDLLLPYKASPMDMASLISESLPEDATVVRIHVGGDFFNEDYMAAWIMVALLNPEKTFYAYTKSLNYWVSLQAEIPANFKLNASKGGRHDNLITQHNLKYAEVVYTEAEAAQKGLEIDHDDSHAFLKDQSFALLIHGVQPAGSVAAQALKDLKGVGSYSKTK
jgi:hypothetical protein